MKTRHGWCSYSRASRSVLASISLIPDYLDWKRENKVFSALNVFAPYGFMMKTRRDCGRPTARV